MLILSRTSDEEIFLIGSDGLISIRVVDILGSKVRLGVSAPEGVAVHRKEVWERIQAGEPERSARGR